MNAPVLLVIFKRPAMTRRALEAIANAAPSRVFVAADGPRNPEERRACQEARAVVDDFASRLPITRNYADENLGCGIRVHTAISWAFEHTDELIILEDDCLPNSSFFTFCNAMLERYASDERVMHVSGDNFVGPDLSGPHSYYFSKYTHASGWATWRRAWNHFDWAIDAWPELRDRGVVQQWCSDPYEQRYWTDLFDGLHGGARDIWDLQWNLTCWSEAGLVILPAVNLVKNDGWGVDATHTPDPLPWPQTDELELLTHPRHVLRNTAADAWTFDHNFGGAALKAFDRPSARLRRRVRQLLAPARFVKRLAMRAVAKATGPEKHHRS